MTRQELLDVVALGEDSRRQFKADVTNADSLAADFAAFANSRGGVLLLGVSDTGVLHGLTPTDVRRLNQLIGNVASQHVRSPISPSTENVPVSEGRVVIVVEIPEGLDRPYFDRHGVIWVKSGSDRRRIQSREELRRLFQLTDQFSADELPTRAGPEALDRLRFRDFLQDVYQLDFPEQREDLIRLLHNLNLATDTGKLNLAGLLLFAEEPQRLKPQFLVKAVRFPGVSIHAEAYVDSEDFSGPLPEQFAGALAFVRRNMPKLQGGRGVNTTGMSPIPDLVFEELLVNALVHRDYLISAPIRLLLFDDRVEVISPGHLPNHLTIEQIRKGNSNIRNPVLVSFTAKGLMPYRGLGSGIVRALEVWPGIEFVDDREGCVFTAIVWRSASDEHRVTSDEGQIDGGSTAGAPRVGGATKSGVVVTPHVAPPTKSGGVVTPHVALPTTSDSVVTPHVTPPPTKSGGEDTPQVTPPPTKSGVDTTPHVTPPSTQSATPHVEERLARLLTALKCSLTRAEAMAALDLRDRKHFISHYLGPAMEQGLVEPTVPDRPRSRLQRYYLTEKGRVRLAELSR